MWNTRKFTNKILQEVPTLKQMSGPTISQSKLIDSLIIDSSYSQVT